MSTPADAYFDRYVAHRRQCAKCKVVHSYDDPRLCALGARMIVAWLDAEVRFGSRHVRRVAPHPEAPR